MNWMKSMVAVFALSMAPACLMVVSDPGQRSSPRDADDDRLDNAAEARVSTDPYDPDTDDDGLTDGEEVLDETTDPLSADTDQDGLDDGEEVFVYYTDPNYSDSDEDGYTDGEEVRYGMDPLRWDRPR